MTESRPDYNAMGDDAFRQLVRNWIVTHYPLDVINPAHRLRFEAARPWYEALSRAGWLAPGWPVEHGGLGLSAGKQLILMEEQERHGCARLNDMGVVMIGPLLIRYGTDAQRAFFLPKILSGEHVWCQGYSEPNAGSDLASLRTEAVLKDGEWVVNGQKIWTTRGADANWMFALVRTDKSARKQEGISFLLIPMDSRGLKVRPIQDISLDDELCETFFDDVHVPESHLVGEVNKGWSMAKALLGFERIFLGAPKHSEYALSRVALLAREMGCWDDPVFRDRYVRLQLDLEDHKALYETFVDQVRRGQDLGPDVSLLKLHQSELFQRMTEFMLEMAEMNAGCLDPMEGKDALNPASQFFQARPTTIYGGSSEIQRTIIARQVLGLPG
ncbi:acyl-CoA dehydrogenase family protein [Hydrogenophaga sp. BPS33]|uniref:acyl-CoA dehydrogenase family protein n=1 Tax=Hydrogenophaga sp. BPS33 TaxID=2651974 RepID=UPI00131FF916|nr:acyl-CoA dehydrogenase family protein [Hydrogenophaga sp. BPS33]QHE84159.1 acyl-CoA dehydrogenase [Hydrogenophaga sp. BPS33]